MKRATSGPVALESRACAALTSIPTMTSRFESKRVLWQAMWLAGAIALVGCAPNVATVRNEGARLLGCADVKIVWVQDLDYDATGCGLMVSMRCDKTACRGLTMPATQPQTASMLAIAQVLATKSEPPPSCTAIGVAEGRDFSLGVPQYEVALDNLRKIAAERGANYLTLDEVRSTGNRVLVGGRLFKCPLEVTARGAPSSCVPDCSPGFACVNATCVSACNPPCAATQECGADRICRAAH
jgi:hypothetical protein